MKRIWITVAAAAAALAAALGAAGSQAQEPGTATPDEQGRLVPDLVAIMPDTAHIEYRESRRRGTRRLLSFAGGVVNNGAGPFVVRTERGNLGFGRLSARQAVVRSDGRRVLAGSPLQLRYAGDGRRGYFHLADFLRYELRTV